jgi:pimeloyl-ACP methyl ester carboxylesterase
VSSLPFSPSSLVFSTDSIVAGLAIAERRVENPKATVICIHGGLDRGASFGRLSRRLENFDVIAYDRRGYQGSRGLTPLSFEKHIEDLCKIVEEQSGPVILFGHSFGGVIAQGLAIKHPGKVDLVVTYESPTPWVLHRELNRPPLTDDARYEAEHFFTRMVSRKIWDRLSEEERESRRLDGEGLLSDLRELRYDAPFDITELKTPSAYIHGDGIIGEYYIALCKELNKVVPSMKTIAIEKANHGAHLQNPDQLSELITSLWSQTCA